MQFLNGPKILEDTSPKKIYEWQKCIWKDVPHHMSSGEYKLKQQDPTTHLLEWPQSGTLTAQNADEMWGSRALIHCWWDVKLEQPLWKTVWQFFYKTRYSLTYDLNN